MPHKRQGKIARLPFELRTKVNEMLRDGAAYKAIIIFLESQDVFGVSENNISNWKDGGHQEWIKDQERIEDLRVRSESALELVKSLNAEKTHIVDANQLVLASQISEVLNDFNPQLLKELLAENPKQFFQLANLINSQTNERTKREKLELEFQKYRDVVAEQKAKIEAATSKAKAKGGLTKETLREIEQAAALL